jgi:hypothetical protein
MIGETSLELAVLPRADSADVLASWERFALPVRAAPAAGGGRLPTTGTLLDVGGAALSSIRRRDDGLEVRVWNPSQSSARAIVGDETCSLPPARIETVRLRRA